MRESECKREREGMREKERESVCVRERESEWERERNYIEKFYLLFYLKIINSWVITYIYIYPSSFLLCKYIMFFSLFSIKERERDREKC